MVIMIQSQGIKRERINQIKESSCEAFLCEMLNGGQ